MSFYVQDEVIGLRMINADDRERFFYIQQEPTINKYIRVPQPDSEVEEFFQVVIHPCSGQGYATRAMKLLISYLRENYYVHKFVAHCHVDNLASERVMQKLGMVKEAELRENFKIGDTWVDEVAYGVLVSELE